MALRFLGGSHRGVVTTRYPRGAPEPWTQAPPTPPVLEASQLNTVVADQLIALGPRSALRRDNHVLIYVGACTACGRCVAAAPSIAYPSGAYELAVNTREHLITRINLPKSPLREEPS